MRLATQVLSRFQKQAAVKVKIHLRRTEAARAQYGEGLVIGKFESSIPLFRVMDGEELRNVADTGEIKGGDYAVPAERRFGAQWGSNKMQVAKWGDSQRGARLGHELFMAEIDGKGKVFAHINMGETVLKDLPKAGPYEPGKPEQNWHITNIPESECSTGLGCSLQIGLKNVKAWYVVKEGGKPVKTPWSKLQEQTPELGLKPREIDLWWGVQMVPQPGIRAWLAWELSGKRLGRTRDREERERLRDERWRQRAVKEPSNWQKLLFKKACAAEDCSTWYTAPTRAQKGAQKSSPDGKRYAILFRARATVAVPHHEAKILGYDLTQIQVHDPESGRWEQIWNGMFNEPIQIGKDDYPMDYIAGSLLKRTIIHKVAHKFMARDLVNWTEDDFLPTLGEAQAIHRRLQAWINKFPGVLARAEIESRGIPDGWVWQIRLRDYWERYEAYRVELEELDHILDGIALTFPHLEQAATLAREATFDPPPEARLVHAFGLVEFFPHYRTGKDHIAYSVERLKEWSAAFGSWVVRSTRTLEQQKQAHSV